MLAPSILTITMHDSGVSYLLQSLLIRAVLVITTSTLPELGAVFGNGSLELPACEPAAMARLAELLRIVELTEANSNNAILFFVVQSDIGDDAVCLCLLADISLDLEKGSRVFVKLL